MTILIVEDEPTIALTLVRILEKNGYPVVSVANGFEALTYLQQHVELPRLILLDLSRPVMSGWEFRDKQLRDSALADIPVVIMSALLNGDHNAAALRIHGWLAKPIPIPILLSTVARYYRQDAGAEMIA